MGYLTEINCEKTCDNWDKEDGASGKSWYVDNWSNSIQLDVMPTAKDIDRMLDRYGISFSDFRLFDSEHDRLKRRFTMCRVEDNDGNEDSEGKFLADYDIIVTVSKIEQVETPDFGLPRD